MEIHRILGDKVRLYRRAEGGAWHCSTYLKSKEWRRSTKQRSLAKAKDVAEDWYFQLCAKDRYGELRSGKARTAYSPRHSYICFRLLEGADIYQVAKNCRTSVEMIEKHYAAQLKDMIDTSLVNVRRERQKRKDEPKEQIEGSPDL